MCAALHDAAVVDDEQLVRFPNSGEPVRDDERGPAGQGLAEGALDRRLRLGVKVGCLLYTLTLPTTERV